MTSEGSVPLQALSNNTEHTISLVSSLELIPHPTLPLVYGYGSATTPFRSQNMANISMLVKRFSELAVQFEEVEQTKRRELF
jgi:hypothetical protein